MYRYYSETLFILILSVMISGCESLKSSAEGSVETMKFNIDSSQIGPAVFHNDIYCPADSQGNTVTKKESTVLVLSLFCKPSSYHFFFSANTASGIPWFTL